MKGSPIRPSKWPGKPGPSSEIVTVTRSAELDHTSSVDVVLSPGAVDPATPNDDFTAGPVSVDFLPGETTKTVPIEVLGDNTVELDETLSLSFSGGPSVTRSRRSSSRRAASPCGSNNRS